MASFDSWGFSSWLRGKFLPAGDELSVSERLVRHLALPSPTSSFVLALQVPQAPGSVVYILVAQQLSERSALDAHRLIAAVRPRVVVSQIEAHSLQGILQEEGAFVAKDAELSYPASILDVLRARFFDAGRFEETAGPSVVRAVFGTGFYGHIIAGKQAAASVDSLFFYLEDPFRQESTANAAIESESTSSAPSASSSATGLQSRLLAASSVQGDLSTKPFSTSTDGVVTGGAAPTTGCSCAAFQSTGLSSGVARDMSVGAQTNAAHVQTTGAGSDFHKGPSIDPANIVRHLRNLYGACARGEGRQSLEADFNNSLTSVSAAPRRAAFAGFPRRSLSPCSLADFRAVYPGGAFSLAQLKPASGLGGVDEPNEGVGAAVAYEFPAFALPLDPWLTGLYELYKELPGIRQALLVTRKMLVDVELGQPVNPLDLAESRSFRVAVEAVRTAYNRDAQVSVEGFGRSGSRTNDIDFRELPYEEQCNVLLAQALKQQARKFDTVVAIMDACSVAQIRKHWNTVIPAELTDAIEDLFIISERDEANGSSDKQKETKTAVVVGAGAVAAVGLASVPHWAPVSTAAKVLTFKVPAAFKLVLLQAKRTAAVFVAKVAAPASKAVVPSVKAATPAFVPTCSTGTSAYVSGAVKTFVSAGKTKAVARSLVAAAERASLSAIRMAFYSVMRNRLGKSAGSRPWLILGSSVAAGSALWSSGDGIERVIADLPSASGLARLGRGLENLRLASHRLREVDTLASWEDTYGSLDALGTL